MNEQQIEQAAQLLHDWNRAYCTAIGDPANMPWEQAPQHQRESGRDAIRFVLHNPRVSPEEMHQEWINARTKQGWTQGAVKNEDLKTHPNLVPYEELPESQRVKDTFARTAAEFIKGLDQQH